MTDFTQEGNTSTKTSIASSNFFARANCVEIKKDLEFFLLKSQNAKDPVISKRYARSAIVFTAFYFESLANLLLKRLREKYGCHDAFEDYLTIECDWAHPLLIFLAVYIFVYNKKFVTKKRDDIMPIDISPIKDLFVITL